jgi:anti-sigma regulatory factor (Ser/Thr protein kinase)
MADLGIGADQRADAELAIGELVANARLHAPGPYELRARAGGRAVTFAVRDGGDDHAAIERRLTRPPVWLSRAEHGRGLQIVATLFPGACGAGPAVGPSGGPGPGKQVWFRVAIPAEPGALPA